MVGSDENENKEKVEYSISITKKHKLINSKNCLTVVGLIVVAAVAGYIGGNVATNKKIQSEVEGSNKMELFRSSVSDTITKVQPSIVTISSSSENLIENQYNKDNISGVIIDEKGYIITNLSKVENYEKIYIKISTGGSKPIEGTLVGLEKESDIALIKIEAENLVPAVIADDRTLREGEFVIAIGNAISDSYVGIATPGIVTSSNDKIIDSFGHDSHRVIQTNAIINELNTGGPICNDKGEVIAISSSKLASSFNQPSLYYGIGGEGIKNITDHLINLVDVLGISGGIEIKDEKTGLQGVYIKNVKVDGSAAKSGMMPTDIILSMDGKRVKTPENIYNVVKDKKSGDTIKCDILRDGIETEINITL